MTQLTPMLSSGTLTLIVFAVIVAFIAWGSTSLRRHINGVQAPHESELTEQGRRAQEFEHHFVEHRPVPEQPLRGESPEQALRAERELREQD